MKGLYSIYACIILITCLLSACDEVYILPDEVDTTYFPLEIGNYIIYQIDSTVYDDFNMVKNERTLQVREIVESTFTDASGEESFRIVREYRDSSLDDWGSVGYDIWFSSFEGLNAERIEENQRYVKLAFPVSLGKIWDGNVHINIDPDGPLGYLEGWEYEISEIHEPLSMNGMNFDSVLTVIQQSSGTVIDTVGAREMYAKHVGLIYKELWVLESQCTMCQPDDTQCIIDCQQSPWEDKAERGFIVKQQILEYGRM